MTWAGVLLYFAASSVTAGVLERVLDRVGVAGPVDVHPADGRPGLGDYAVPGVRLAYLGLDEVRVQLDLVDRGHDVGAVDEVLQVVGVGLNQ
ncbi:hypothetical protein G9272_01895 [Streptomyces asoensis]|uniref:Uncharacterized protein n=1 Tax=Streptomyces asoensis TaxID=249586 RepID=A0A6M4WF73_9ACTN|nr:hypothetical protein [Streptomyces asoensis]QJS99219.1 hypothetical protein G9272_01895 [Streptomyces asoensis]